jgi:NADPH-dependent 2,4-dienoyl-CoA reductase/sulfur reductase-like enzyme/bacterioferritin-associated ferredoxin
MPRDADVIVIGAGPAGMSAAVELSAAGLSVIVLDMNASPGGQIYRAVEANLNEGASHGLANALGAAYSAGQPLVAQFRVQSNIDYRPNTVVWELRTDGTVGWQQAGRGGYLRARHVVLANGAMERPMPFPGWTLPGVMTAGAVQTLIKASRLKPSGRVVLAGTGPLLFLLADQLLKLAVRPALIARTDGLGDKLAALPRLRPAALPALAKGAGWMANLRRVGVRTVTSLTHLEAVGNERLREVVIKAAGKTMRLPCDLLIVHDGIIPSIDLAQGAGIAMEWRPDDASWRPVTDAHGLAKPVSGPSLSPGPNCVWLTGDARTIGGADAAAAHGMHVGQTIAASLGAVKSRHASHSSPAKRYAQAMAARPFIDAAFPPGRWSVELGDATIICRCEEITAAQIRSCAQQGVTDMDQLRGLLRCGMGPCQGRSCATAIARLLSREFDSPLPMPFRGRPPVRPVPLGVLAQLQSLDPDLSRSEALDDKPDASSRGGIDV